MPPFVNDMTPQKGKVSGTALIHGNGLRGSSIVVKFGLAQAIDAANPGNSDENIKMTIPNKDPRNTGDTVQVTVAIDGEVAQLPSGGLSFSYNIPQPAPTISGFSSSPVAPLQLGQAFIATFTGTDLTTSSGRVPDTFYAIGADNEQGTLSGTPTAKSISATFPGLQQGGDYQFFIGFNDGSGVTIYVPGLVQTAPPV